MSTNPNTVPQPTVDELRKVWQNKKSRAHKVVDIDTDQKYAVVALLLSPGVTQPDDYGTLGAALNGIAGIADVKLLIDGQTVATVPAGEELKLMTQVAVRQVTTPIVEE